MDVSASKDGESGLRVVRGRANFAAELAGSVFPSLLCCRPAELGGCGCWFLSAAPSSALGAERELTA